MIDFVYFILLSDLGVLALIIYDLVKRKDISKTNPLIYLLIVFSIFSIYFIAQAPYSDNLLEASFEALSAMSEAIIFKLNYTLIAKAFANYPLFKFTFFLTILIAYYYILRLVINLFVKYLSNYFKVQRLIKKPVIVVIAHNKEADRFIKNNPRGVILWDKDAPKSNVPVFRGELSIASFQRLSKYKAVEFVTFKAQEESLKIANTFFLSLSEDDFVNSNLFLTIVVEHHYSQVYEVLIEKGRGLIKVINKYDIMAKELIKHHPFSKYLDKETFLEKNGLIKSECEIQGVFIGYGKVNLEVYLKTIMNNQFATQLNNEIIAKVVKYHIIEKEQKQHNKILNHTFFRYETTSFDESEYLPEPELIHQTTYHQLDINNKEFYDLLKRIFQTPKSATFVFISIDSDLENLDLVLKLKEYIKYQGFQNIKLFVRMEDYLAINDLFTIDTSLEDIIIFGTYDDYINERVLFARDLENAAIEAAVKYEETHRHKNKETLVIKPRHNWTSLSIYKQESNRQAILNLNFKLNLISYTLFDQQDEIVKLEDFYQDYDPNNERNKVNDRLSYQLTSPYQTRDVLAFIEHLRWNAFHLCHGYIPLKKEFITFENNKDIKLKLHGCLTSFHGLDLYHEHLIKQIKDSKLTYEEKYLQVDVKKYDYNILDDLENNLKQLNTPLRKRN